MSDYLFVYGTLRPGFVRPHLRRLVDRLGYIGPGWVHGRLYDLGSFPGAIFDPSETARVVGDILQLPEIRVLAALDAYEAFFPLQPTLSQFVRVQQPITLVNDGGQLHCWAYAYNRPLSAALLLPDGDYAAQKAIHPLTSP